MSRKTGGLAGRGADVHTVQGWDDRTGAVVTTTTVLLETT
jgi:hypothetical protein